MAIEIFITLSLKENQYLVSKQFPLKLNLDLEYEVDTDQLPTDYLYLSELNDIALENAGESALSELVGQEDDVPSLDEISGEGETELDSEEIELEEQEPTEAVEVEDLEQFESITTFDPSSWLKGMTGKNTSILSKLDKIDNPIIQKNILSEIYSVPNVVKVDKFGQINI